MATHSIGKDNTKIQLVLPDKLHAKLAQLAAESDVSVAHFCRRLLKEAAESEVVYPAKSGVFEDPGQYDAGSKAKTLKEIKAKQ